MANNNFVSGGRNVNQQKCCDAPRCRWLEKAIYRGGWCGNPANRTKPTDGWPNGFTPSVSSDGGCDLWEAVE